MAVALPQAGVDLLRFLATNHSPGIPPSDLVVANARRQRLAEFLSTGFASVMSNSLAKFIVDRHDADKRENFRLPS